MIQIIHILESIVPGEKNSIYLAGPTFRNGGGDKISWRGKALEILNLLDFDGIVYVPEYKNNTQPAEWTYSRQIDWELDAMKESGVILFWIPRDLENLPAFTTNIEVGEWLKSKKIVAGAPIGAPKNEYIQERCSRLNIHWSVTIENCVNTALRKLKESKEPENKIWFTADTHFGHQRTLELSKRPFSSVSEMDWQIVANWNKTVEENDTVYHLGDFGTPKVLRWLTGKSIKFLAGNYDNPEIIYELLKDPRVERIHSGHLISLNEKCFRLIHEPENAINRGDFFLFGHIHNSQKVKRNGLNIGVDCHNFFPVSIETIMFFRNAIMNHFDENVFLERMGT